MMSKKYAVLQKKLRSLPDAIKSTIEKYRIEESDEGFIKEIIDSIACAVKPELDIGNFVFMNDLSKEQLHKIEKY